jgi:hypothetical protein
MALASATYAQSGGERIRVRFAKGETSAVLKGRIVGYQYKEYLIDAKAGQTMTLKLTDPQSRVSFTIYTINGRAAETMAPTEEWSGPLTESGEYAIRVAMPRAFARRRGARASYTLTVTIR